MLSIGTCFAPSQSKLNYFLFFNESENILPLKKQYSASPESPVLYAFRGIHVRWTILAESIRHFMGLAVGETVANLSAAKGGMRRGKECPRS